MHLWKKVDSGDGWVSLDVAPDGVSFVEGRMGAGVDAEPPLALVVPFSENGVERAALLASPLARSSIRVNGSRLLGGLRVLEERDEFCIGGRRYYFARGTTLEPRPLPAEVGEAICARCSDAIAEGDMAVRCPACGSWLHEGRRSHGEEWKCWSYAAECVCGAERDELAWTPEEEHGA